MITHTYVMNVINWQKLNTILKFVSEFSVESNGEIKNGGLV